jgi:NADH-quinone oxidoreductase subunit N
MNPAFSLTVVKQTALVLVPEITLLFCAIVMMVGSAFYRQPRRYWFACSQIANFLAIVLLLLGGRARTELYSAVALNDDLSFYARLVLLCSGAIVLALAHREPDDLRSGEFFGALLMMNAGAMIVAAANEMVFLFVGLELVSIPTYLILYLSKRNPSTQEAATKYFYLSIFASGLFLYGLTFLYGTTGVSNLKALGSIFETMPELPSRQLGLVAVVFVMAGLCFRVAAVPLQFYAPDVYQGSPMVVAATLAWIPKVVGFLAIVRTLTAVFAVKGMNDSLVEKAVMLSWIIAAATMVWGNFLALLQEDLKRLMAYSSIAHAGYMMVGVTAAFAADQHADSTFYGSESIFFYLVTYGLMTLGVFGGFMALQFKNRPVETVDDLSGIGWTHGWRALGISVCLLSLAGIPPLAGFWGKLQLFGALLAAGERAGSSSFVVLAVIGMLSAAAGAYYYLRIVVVMYFSKPKDAIEVTGGWPIAAAVSVCVFLTVYFGINSAPLSSRAHAAARAAVAHPQPNGASVAER